mgnify:FL=1|tara:strand:- start:2805 stop:3815 length:1011 start_codon:yes stop_codon:yes gene_type:complete
MPIKKEINQPYYIDLFSGAGGFSKGFQDEGFLNVFSIDCNNQFCKTYKKNFPEHTLLEKKIEDLTETEIQNSIKNKNVDVIIGGPPCQGFSIAGNIGRRFLDDPRNKLFLEMCRVIEIIKPKIAIIENVARLNNHNKGATKKEIFSELERIGYKVESKILNAFNYGVPQHRRRIFFIASLLKGKILFPEEEEKGVTVKEAIGNYPRIPSGGNSSVNNHKAMNHSRQMLDKMAYVQDGGDRNNIPIEIRPSSGDIRKYIRYSSKKPSVTITGDMRKVFHYDQNRALTVRELAKLQSFDDDFYFEGHSISQQQQVGNSVPPKLAKCIASSVKTMLING